MPSIEATSGWLTLPRLLAELVRLGLVEQAQAKDLNRLYKSRSAGSDEVHPVAWLAARQLKSAKAPHELLTAERLTEILSNLARLPYFRIDPLKIDVDAVTQNMSKAYAQRHRILPVAVDDDEVIFATAEPFSLGWSSDLSRMLNRTIRCVVANPLDIARYQEEFFGISSSLRKARQGAVPQAANAINNLEALVELGRSGKLDANDSHIVSIVDWVLQYAFQQRASDIHIEPRREQGQIRFRIDGDLHLVYEMPTSILIAVTSRIKALGRMDVVDKRRPQDGRVKTSTPNGKEVELRLSTMPTAFGEKLVMRIFDPEVLVSDMSALGFSQRDSDTWVEMTRHTHGIILVTGPTGSGKTTTLYSTLKSLYRPEINICTIEDPIEMVESHFNQMQVNHSIGVDFAAGVRTLLRQDPDIVMVGEIRDLETAQMAIQAALTGHLVLSTLHTNDAVSAVTRLTEIGVPAYLINATLLGVVAQRLVRRLCPHCRTQHQPDEDVWRALVSPVNLPLPKQIFESEGCGECRGTGFHGRIGIYELLRVDSRMRALIKQDSSVDEMREQARNQGVDSLRISGAHKVALGLTNIAEVLRVTPSFDDF